MTYRIVVEPTAEREIRSTVRWKTENASPAVAARWYNGLVKKIDTLRRHKFMARGLADFKRQRNRHPPMMK